jgi:hypothetical protein
MASSFRLIWQSFFLLFLIGATLCISFFVQARGGGLALTARLRLSHNLDGTPATDTNTTAPFRFCGGFPRAGCPALLASGACTPKDAFYWQAKTPSSGGCISLDGAAEVQSDAEPACSSDVAVVVISSENTASRMAAASGGWIPAALALNMSVIVAAASDVGAAAVRAVAPGLDVRALGVPEQQNNGGFAHVRQALRLLVKLHPMAKWYMKIDDDAFLFPTNLLHALVFMRVNSSQRVIMGNSLSPGSKIASGGAGYVLSRTALVDLLAAGDACFDGVEPASAEDVAMATCLQRLDTTFVHGPGFNMANPRESFTHWRRHAWTGAARFPVTFHWLLDEKLQRCLACSCLMVDRR